MTPLDALMTQLLPTPEALGFEGALGAELLRIAVSEIEVTLPVGLTYEREATAADGQVLAMPPSIAATTGFDPVFQRLRVRLTVVGEDE